MYIRPVNISDSAVLKVTFLGNCSVQAVEAVVFFLRIILTCFVAGCCKGKLIHSYFGFVRFSCFCFLSVYLGCKFDLSLP